MRTPNDSAARPNPVTKMRVKRRNWGLCSLGVAMVALSGCSENGESHVSINELVQGLATQEAKLLASDGASGDRFGYNQVAISGNTAVIGARYDDNGFGTDAGAAYVFVRTGTTWTQQQKLLPLDGVLRDEFGFSVAVFEDTAIIGASENDKTYTDADALHATNAGMAIATNVGAAYVFTRTGTTWTQQQKIVPPDGKQGDNFGSSVAVFEDTAVIGAVDNDGSGYQKGAAYVYVRSGISWTLQQKLLSDPTSHSRFGVSVAISGDTSLIGAYHEAYAFTRSGTNWTLQQKLISSDFTLYDEYGVSVSIFGDSAIVGAPSRNDLGLRSGAAYVFARTGTTWTQQQKLLASDGAAEERFGNSVGIFNKTAVIGAWWESNFTTGAYSGAAYMFARTGTTWTQQQKILASGGAANDWFGCAVAMSGQYAVIGAYEDDDKGLNSGSAYIFNLGHSLGIFSPEHLTTLSSTSATFQWSSGGATVTDWWLYVGAGPGLKTYLDSGLLPSTTFSTEVNSLPANGSTIYARLWYRVSGDSTWYYEDHQYTAQGPLTPAIMSPVPGSTFTGSSATFTWAATNNTLISEWWFYLGTSAGNGWIYDSGSLPSTTLSAVVTGIPTNGRTLYARLWYRESGIWKYVDYTYYSLRTPSAVATQTQEVLPSGGLIADDMYGYAVDIDGDTAIVGAPWDDTRGSGAGTAYVFVKSGATWIQQQKLLGSSLEHLANDQVGKSVAVSGDTVVIGVPDDDTMASNAGAAYVFERSGTTWTQTMKLAMSSSLASDRFGTSVAIEGDYIAVGAPGHDGAGAGWGAIYVFVRGTTPPWNLQQKVVLPSGVANGLGSSVGISDDTMIGGGTNYSSLRGSAAIFRRSGTVWALETEFLNSLGDATAVFGETVAIEGNTAVIGARQSDAYSTSQGAAYVYTRSGTAWTFQQGLRRGIETSSDEFGSSVSISGNYIVVGASVNRQGGVVSLNGGSAFIYKNIGNYWSEYREFRSSDVAGFDKFGNAVAIDGETVLCGAVNHDHFGSGSGGAYMFSLTPSPAMVTPAAGSTLSSSSATFTWTANSANVSQWWLYAGSSAGSRSYYDSGSLGTSTSTIATGLAVDGSAIHVRLWYRLGTSSTWNSLDYQYVAVNSPPAITSPVSGTTLTGSIVSVSWTANGSPVTDYELWAYRGSNIYFNSGSLGTVTSTTVGGIPRDSASGIIFRLWFKIGSVWDYVESTYTAAAPPSTPYFNNPWAGATLGGSSHTLNWSQNGVSASKWQVLAGSSVGASNYYSSGDLSGSATSANVTGLPTNGSTVYVRLRYRIASTWTDLDFTFIAAGP